MNAHAPGTQPLTQRSVTLPNAESRRATLLALAALFALALLVRLAAVWRWQFDGLYGQDAFAYFTQAAAIAANLPQGLPPPTEFYWPNGYPFLAALAMYALGNSALAAQATSLLCGALLAPLVYLLTRALCTEAGQLPGLLAGAILACAAQPVLSSVVIMADIPALFWATLAALLAVYAARRPDQARYFVSLGFAAAMAVVSRWIYGLLIPVFAGYLLWALFGARGPARGAIMRNLLLGALCGAALLLPQLWLTRQGPQQLDHPWLLGWSLAHFFQREFNTVDGYASYALPGAIFYAQPAFHPAYLFPLFTPALPWGIRRLWRSGERAALLLLLGWSGLVYLFLAGIPYQNFRFGLALTVPLLVLAALGTGSLLDMLTPKDHPSPTVHHLPSAVHRPSSTVHRPSSTVHRPSSIVHRLSSAVPLIALAATLAWSYRTLDGFLTAQNESKRIARAVEQTLPAQAHVLSFGLTLTLQHYTRLDVHEIYYLDAAALDTLVREKTPLFLLIDPGIVVQWRDRPPEQNIRRLQTHTRLEAVAVFPPYELWKVHP